jgi:FMN reductase
MGADDLASLGISRSLRTQPLIVGIGGTTREDSSSERALRAALRHAASLGARTQLFAAHALDLPMYDPGDPLRTPAAQQLVQALRECDGVLIASPGYHGSISGLVKNALDYVEDLRSAERPYLEGRAVGCIACAYGWQAVGTTLVTLRTIVHALRAWPTPFAAAINTSTPIFDANGECVDEAVATQLALVARQVNDFAVREARLRLVESMAA